MGRSFCPGGAAFDGATDVVNASVTATSSPYVTVSLWFKSSGPESFQTLFINNPSSYSTKFIVSSGVLQMSFGNPTGTPGGVDIYQNFVNDYFDGQWHHVLVTADMSNAGAKTGVMCVDGIDVTGVINSFGAAVGNIVLNAYPFYIGDDTFADPYTGDLAELWVMPGLNLISGGTISPADIAKFYAGSCPVDLGDHGQIPTGTAPPIYLTRGPSAPATDWLVNQGSGGCFSADVGAITAAAGPCACTGGQISQGMIF